MSKPHALPLGEGAARGKLLGPRLAWLERLHENPCRENPLVGALKNHKKERDGLLPRTSAQPHRTEEKASFPAEKKRKTKDLIWEQLTHVYKKGFLRSRVWGRPRQREAVETAGL